MNKTLALLTREIPVYKVYLGWLALLLFLVIVGSIFNPSPCHKSRAQANFFKTRSDEKFFAFMLKNQLVGIDLLVSNEFILRSIPVQYNFGFVTDRAGAMIDVWKTPFQIQFVERTNFIIRSAGKDKIFGDADDIIFNSISNDFVKP